MAVFCVSITTTIEWNEAITAVSEAISRHGGWITNHTFFSNMAATINYELPNDKIDDFIAWLKKSSMDPSIGKDVPRNTDGDMRCQISLTFIHDDPELKRNVPDFG